MEEDDNKIHSSPILIEEITQPEKASANEEEDIQTLSPPTVIPDTPIQQEDDDNSLDSTKSPVKADQPMDSELMRVHKDESNQPEHHPDSIFNADVAIKTTPSPCLTEISMSQMTPTQVYTSPNDEPSNPIYSSTVTEDDESMHLHVTPSQPQGSSYPPPSYVHPSQDKATASQIQGNDDIMEMEQSRKVTFGSKTEQDKDTSSTTTEDKHDTEDIDVEEQFMLESTSNPVYRITRRVITIRETIVNRLVVNTSTSKCRDKVSWYSDKQSSSGSGSGYAADTSSISNSSSGCNMKRTNSNTTSEHSEEFVTNSPIHFRTPAITVLRRSNSDNTSSSSKSSHGDVPHPAKVNKENVNPATPHTGDKTSLIHTSAELISRNNSKVDTPEDFHVQQMSVPKSTPLQPRTIHEELPKVSIDEAIPVLAKATLDGFYYPGKVFSKDDNVPGKYTVLFEDDQVSRSIRESDILQINLLPVGQDVFIQAQSDSDDSQVYAEGTVVGYSWKENKKCYVVKKYEVDTKQFHTDTYLRKQVIVKHEHLSPQFRKMLIRKTNVQQTGGTVTLDNIVSGKRTRRNAKNSPSTKSTLSPSTRSSPSTPPTGRKRPWKSRSDDSSSSSVCMPLKPKRGKRSKLFQEDDSPLVLPENKSLFANCGFLLTGSQQQPNSSSETDTDGVSYNRVNIRKMIVAGGGIVAEEFPYLMTCASNLYVISDDYCRTGKYLCALAACVPCLSFMWIINSCKDNNLQMTKSYTLAAGHSITQKCTVERPAVPIQPLSGLKIAVLLVEPEMTESILRLAGCHLITLPTNISAKGTQLSCEILVTDISCPSTVLSRARSLSIPVVSTEWPIQCLINSQQVPFHLHDCPEFKHDHIK